MKGLIFALTVLFLVLALTVTNSLILRSMIDDTIDSVEKIEIDNAETAKKSFEKCYEHFERRERFISLTVSHSDLTDIDECFSEIIGAGNAFDIDNMIRTKNRLINSLEHLRRLSGLNIDSILFTCKRPYPCYTQSLS